MPENFLLEKAIKIAVEAHAGQVDKGGEAYILHPLAVMNEMPTTDAKIVAVLHDVVEDTHWELEQLIAEGFPPLIVSAIDALTHRPNEPRVDYYKRVNRHPLARAVKLKDIDHNLNPARLRRLAPETQTRLKNKYANARVALGLVQ